MALHLQPSQPELVAWLTHRVADRLALPTAAIDSDVALDEYGFTSLLAIALCADIRNELDVAVEPTLARDHPTITLIAEFLAGELSIRS